MLKYIVGRLLQIILVFLLFQTFVFFLLDAQPGNIGNQLISNTRLTPENRELMQARLGLNKPPLERYLTYIGNFYRLERYPIYIGNFYVTDFYRWSPEMGISYFRPSRTVFSLIMEVLPRTLVLFMTATVVAFYVGFAAGKHLAWSRGGFIEYSSTIVGVTLYTVFLPWFGLMMLWLFALQLGRFPAGKFVDVNLWRNTQYSANEVFSQMILFALVTGVLLLVVVFLLRYISPLFRARALWAGVIGVLLVGLVYWALNPMGQFAFDIARHLILPVTTLTLVNFAGYMLLTRNTMLETLREDYILTARAKGLPEEVIRDKHAARNALLPVVTSLVYAVAFAISGGIITESIFSWGGIGTMVLDSATNEDIPLAIGCLQMIGVLALGAHLIADILYAYLDPRIRYE